MLPLSVFAFNQHMHSHVIPVFSVNQLDSIDHMLYMLAMQIRFREGQFERVYMRGKMTEISFSKKYRYH